MEIGHNQGLLQNASAIARAAEQSGFDSLWLGDRVEPLGLSVPVAEGGSGGSAGIGVDQDLDMNHAGNSRRNTDGEGTPFEAYSMLGALAIQTSSMRLGALPKQAELRAPSVLCKIVTTVDVISKGRGALALAIDAEDVGATDVERLEEQLALCRSMFDDDRPSYAGRFYTIDGAVNRPRPVQSGGVPIVVRIGGRTPIATSVRAEILRVAATHADAVIVDGDPDVVADARRSLRAFLPSDGGRGLSSEPGPLHVIWVGAAATAEGNESDQSDASLTVAKPSVSPNRLADQIKELQRAGADGCILSVSGGGQLEFLRDASPMRSLWR
jgi:alkanesulfonate monooxygenase SsuD/methylene tetrahydromethanopterin reductase-like flavin-dependent oxidoreductase (luciferase family)